MGFEGGLSIRMKDREGCKSGGADILNQLGDWLGEDGTLGGCVGRLIGEGLDSLGALGLFELAGRD